MDGDRGAFERANYCTDKAMMEQRALHETLNRLLWRYSEEHGGDNEWNDKNIHWFISKSEQYGFTKSACKYDKYNGVVYFKDAETAQSAIEEIVKPFMEQHPELVW